MSTDRNKCCVPDCELAIVRQHFMCPCHWPSVPDKDRREAFRRMHAWENGVGAAREYLAIRSRELGLGKVGAA